MKAMKIPIASEHRVAIRNAVPVIVPLAMMVPKIKSVVDISLFSFVFFLYCFTNQDARPFALPVLLHNVSVRLLFEMK